MGEEREGKRQKGKEDSTEEEREERPQPLQRHNHPVHQVPTWSSALRLLSQQPFLEQAIAWGLKAFYPQAPGSGPRLQPLSERTLLASLGWGAGRSFPFFLGFHHFSLLQV